MVFYFFSFLYMVLSTSDEYQCRGSNAGWRCNYRAEYSQRNGDHHFCDVDIISPSTTWLEFESKYYFKKPVIINTSLSDWTQNTSFWNKGHLLSLFGDHEFEVGRSDEAIQNGGIMQQKLSLSSYIKQLTKKKRNKNKALYLFDRSLLTNLSLPYIYSHIIKLKSVPYLVRAHDNIKRTYDSYHNAHSLREYNSLLFSLGETGSGIAFHEHGETWLFLVYGRKRWFLYPPNIHPVGGIKPGFTSYDWYKRIYKHLNTQYNNDYQYINNKTFIKPRSSIFTRNNGTKTLNMSSTISDILSTDYTQYNDNNIYGLLFKPIECMMLEGQIMYIPESWWHQALNLGDTLSIGFQINNAFAGYRPVANWTAYYWRIYTSLMNKAVLDALNKTDLEMESIKVNKIINIEKRISDQDEPLNAVNQYFVGNDLCQMGYKYYKECRKHLMNAILMDPSYIYSYLTLATTYMDHNYGYSLDMAQKVLEIAYALNPNHEKVQEKLIQVYSLTNQMDLIDYVRRGKRI